MRARWKGFHSCLSGPIRQFLDHKRALGRHYRTEEAALRLLDQFLLDNEIPAPDLISTQLLDRFFVSRPRRRPRSFNHLVGVVERLFRWLVHQEILDRSPVRATHRRATETRRPFLFNRDSAGRLLQAAGQFPDRPKAPLRGPAYRTIFALLYGLGLRVGEVTRLCRGDVDLDQDILSIRCTKFSKDRLVPFGPSIHGLLTEFLALQAERRGELATNDPFFCFVADRAVHPCTISQTFHALIPRLELQIPPGTSPPRLHDLRHSFAVATLLRWYQMGIAPGQRIHHLATFLGHVDPTSTAVYLTITEELLDQANTRFERYASSFLAEVQS